MAQRASIQSPQEVNGFWRRGVIPAEYSAHSAMGGGDKKLAFGLALMVGLVLVLLAAGALSPASCARNTLVT